MLVDSEAIGKAVELGLKPADFYRDLHGEICSAIYSMREKGAPVDLATVGEYFEDLGAGRLAEIGGMPYLLHLQGPSPSSAAVGHHVGIILEKARLREVMKMGQDLAERASEPGAAAVEIVAYVRDEVSALEKIGAAALKLVPVVEVIAVPQEPPPWIIKPLGAKGCVTLCHGAPQRGKSWVALHVALCVGTGQSLFGQIACEEAGEAIIWDAQLTEYKRWLVDRRLAALCGGMGLNGSSSIPVSLFNGRGVKIDTGEGRAMVRRLLKERQPLLLAIDALVNLHSKDENDNMAMQQVMEPISDLAGEFNCLVWLNHHDRKGMPGVGEDPPASSVRGASAILAEVDTAVALRYSAPYLIFHHTKNRLSGEPLASFTFEIVGDADRGQNVRLVYGKVVEEGVSEQAKVELQIKAAFENDAQRELYKAQLGAILHCEGRAAGEMLSRAVNRLVGAGYLVLSRQEGAKKYLRLNPTHFGL